MNNEGGRTGRSPIKKVRPKKKRKILWGRVILALVVFLAICAGLVWSIGAIYTAIMGSVTNGASPNDTVISEPQKREVQTVSVEQKALDKPIYILVVGKDENSPAEGNSLFLLSMNINQKQMDVIGIPGNTKIDNHHTAVIEPLSNLYRTGGIDLTKAVVEDLFHIVIPYYVVVDKEGFYKMADVAGTPNFYIEKDMYHVDGLTGQVDVNLWQGYQDMNREKSYEYVRYIESDQDGFYRTERQERWLKSVLALQDEAFTTTRMFRIWRMWSTFESNISTIDAMKLVFQMRNVSMQDIHFFIVPGVKEEINRIVYWAANPTGIQQLVGITLGNEDPSMDLQNTPPAEASKNDKNEDLKGDTKDKTIVEFTAKEKPKEGI